MGQLIEGLPDPFTTQFDRVQRAPLTDLSWKHAYTLGIHDQTERKERKTMFYYCTLPVVLEFRYVRQAQEVSSVELNRILYDIQRWLAIDYTWGGLAINTIETSSDIYIDDVDEKKISGAVMVDLTYRHYWNDPSRMH